MVRRVVSFVPQDDLVQVTLTVYEDLYSACLYTPPGGETAGRRGNTVDDNLTTLQLHMSRIPWPVLSHSCSSRAASEALKRRLGASGVSSDAAPRRADLGWDSAASLQGCAEQYTLTNLAPNVVTVSHQPQKTLSNVFNNSDVARQGWPHSQRQLAPRGDAVFRQP